MEMVVFAKTVTWNGKIFPSYFTRLTNKNTGESVTFNVKFRQNCKFQPEIDECPCIIEVPREKMNKQEKPITDKETGEYVTDDNGTVKISKTIWITDCTYVGPFVDHSLDDFE